MFLFSHCNFGEACHNSEGDFQDKSITGIISAYIYWEILNTYEELINLKLTEKSGSVIKIKDNCKVSLEESRTRRRLGYCNILPSTEKWRQLN